MNLILVLKDDKIKFAIIANKIKIIFQPKLLVQKGLNILVEKPLVPRNAANTAFFYICPK